MKLKLQHLISEIRHDPKALFELRQLLFGLIIVFGVVYGFQSLYVQSKTKKYDSLNAQSQQLESHLTKDDIESMTAIRLAELTKNNDELTDRLDRLRFEEEIYRKEFGTFVDDESFSNAVFTLLPGSPVKMESNITGMNVLEKRTKDFYTILPVDIQGDAGFSQLLDYLQFLERRNEIGVISYLDIELVDKDSMTREVDVHFDLVVGRLKL